MGYHVDLKYTSTVARFHPRVKRWGASGKGEMEGGGAQPTMTQLFLEQIFREGLLRCQEVAGDQTRCRGPHLIPLPTWDGQLAR